MCAGRETQNSGTGGHTTRQQDNAVDMNSLREAANETGLVVEGREEHEGQTQHETRTKGIGHSPATPLNLPVKTMETGCIPPLQLSSTSSPEKVEEAFGSSTAVPDDADDPVHTPMPGVWPAEHGTGIGEERNDTLLGAQNVQPIYFGPETTLSTPSAGGAKLASTSTSSSKASSPLRSGHTSSSSFQSSQAGYGSSAELNRIDSSYLQDIGSTTVPISHTTSPIAEEDFALTDPSAPKQTAVNLRKDGPHYPDQSFAALQSQYYPPLYQPHPLRTRRSNPSQGSLYSFTSSTNSRDRASMVSGTRTAGNTPAQSPGLFVSAAKYGNTGDDGREVEYSTSMLHPSHLQAPKE